MLNIPEPGPAGPRYPSSTWSRRKSVCLGSGTWSSLAPPGALESAEGAESPTLVTVVKMTYFDFCLSERFAVCRTGSSNWTYRHIMVSRGFNRG